MNDKLIEILRQEQNNLIPKGSVLIASRGYGKSMMQLAKLIRWNGYELYCQMTVHLVGEETLESAHKWIDDYVIGMMPD